MIKEAYCSDNVCKLLKEKGFNESCYTYYDDIDNSINRFDKGLHFNNTSYPWGVPYDVSKAKKYVVAPTHQMAMAWLREVHNIHISVYVFNRELPITDVPTSYTCDIATKKLSSQQGHLRGVWQSYEQAVEAALKYCLENLI